MRQSSSAEVLAVNEPTVLASTTMALLRFAEREGVDRDELLQRAGVAPALLEDERARIPREKDIAVWTAIERELGDEALGLRYLESLTADAFGPVGLFAMSSATVGEAIGRAARFQHMVKNDCELRTRDEGDAIAIDQLFPGGRCPWPRPIADHAFGTYVTFARRWSGEHVRPREVRFTHSMPRRMDEYHRLFDCPVVFDSEQPGITFDKESLELPLKTAQPEVEAVLARIVEDAARAVRIGDFASAVREAIAEQLRTGQLSLDMIARAMGTSRRTLQRHLTARGLTFQGLVEEVRRARALELLRATDLPIEAISEQLGYAESAVFRRACRRWTGVPPAVLRRRARS